MAEVLAPSLSRLFDVCDAVGETPAAPIVHATGVLAAPSRMLATLAGSTTVRATQADTA